MKAVDHPSHLTDAALEVVHECIDNAAYRLNGAGAHRACRVLWSSMRFKEVQGAHWDALRYQGANGGMHYKRHDTYWP